MARPQRVFVAALSVSLLAHLIMLTGTGQWWILPAEDVPVPIEAILVSQAQPAADASPPAPPATVAAAPIPPAPSPSPSVAPAPPQSASQANPEPEPAPPATLPQEPAPEPLPAATPAPTPEPPAAPKPPDAPAAAPFRRTLPDRLTLRYAVQSGEGGFTLGRATYTWQVRNEHYSLVSVVEATGITALFVSGKIVQTSEGLVTPAGLQPEQFWIAKGKRRQSPVLFDWPQKRLHLPGGSVDLPALAQDLLSFPFHLAMTARDGDGEWLLPVTSGKKLKEYAFRTIGQQALPMGESQVETLHLQGSHASEGTLDVWLAPSRHWLPARIRTLDQKGEIMVLDLESVSD